MLRGKPSRGIPALRGAVELFSSCDYWLRVHTFAHREEITFLLTYDKIM